MNDEFHDCSPSQLDKKIHCRIHVERAAAVLAFELSTGSGPTCKGPRPSPQCSRPVLWSTLSSLHPKPADAKLQLFRQAPLATDRHHFCRPWSPSNFSGGQAEPRPGL